MSLPNAIQGALRPSIEISWMESGTNNAVDLTGATLTGFIQAGNVTNAIAGTLTVTDAPGGVFRWDLAADDVAETGRFQVQFVATYASNPTPAKSFVVGWLVERSL